MKMKRGKIMFNKKRILACILVVVMMSAFLAACADPTQPATDPGPQTPPPATSGTTETPATPDEPEDEMDNNERGLSKFPETVTVNFARNVDPTMVFAPGQSYENNIWMTEYEEVLGINLVTIWEAEGLPAYNERMNLMIAANDLPDMFQVNSAQLMSLINADRLVDLFPYVDHWATDFYKDNLFNGDNGLSVEMSTFNGQLLALPRTSVAEGDYHFMMIREDWRLELGLPEPRSFNDMVEMARAFVEADLDGARAYGWGIGNDTSETWFTMRGLYNSFGAYWNHWQEKDGQLVFGNVQPEMRNALEVIASWYDEGLLDREMAAKNSWAVFEEAMQGRTGIAIGMGWFLGWPLVPDGVANGQLWRPYQIPFHHEAPQQKIASRATVDGGYVVRAGFEHPEALIKMCNLWQDRVMGGTHPVEIYKGDDEFVYEFLAAFSPTNGPDRNLAADVLINENLNAGIMEPTNLNPEEMQWFEHVRDFYNGEVIIQFTREEGADPEEFRATNDEVWEHIVSERFTGRATLSFDDPDNDDIMAQMRGRYVSNFGNYWGRYGSTSIRGLSNALKDNNVLLRDAFFGPPTDSMQEFMASLQDSFNTTAVNIIVGNLPIEAFDQFVTDWYANGGDQIVAEVNEWYRSIG